MRGGECRSVVWHDAGSDDIEAAMAMMMKMILLGWLWRDVGDSYDSGGKK